MKTTCVRVVTGLAILLMVAGRAPAQPRPAALAFTVSTTDPASHLFHVRLDCSRLPGESVEFRMPVWTPGYYGLFDYAANVRNMRAMTVDGQSLPVERTGPNGWTVKDGAADAVVLTYDVLAANPFVANAFLDDTRGYITPGALFVYVPGRLREEVRVAVDLPPSWRDVATGLEPIPGAPHRFRAADFDVLYDSPILMGTLESLPPFEVHGVPHEFVGYQLGEFDRVAFMKDLKAVVDAGIAIIGDIPYSRYVFLGIGPGRGGIEHLNSAAVSFSGISSERAARNRVLAFLAHEYFHHYNVKRIRPVALGPFDYDRPNVTNMLWVSEGFTVYYEYLMLARAGLMTRDELLEAMTGTIATHERNPGRLFQSVVDASRDSWSQGPFGRSGNGLRKTVSYYEKGPILGMLLDFAIRDATENRRSLDNVMRTLYDTYYRRLGRGWTDEEFRQVCERTAGRELGELFAYAATTTPIDYAKYLAMAGLQLEPPTPLPEGYLGALVEQAGDALVVAAVEPGSTAETCGLLPRDEIHGVDGNRVDAAGLQATVARSKPGHELRISVVRAGKPLDVTARLEPRVERSYRMTPVPTPSALQAAILRTWATTTAR